MQTGAIYDCCTGDDLPTLELGRWYFWTGNNSLVRRVDDMRYVAVQQFMYTWGLIWGYTRDMYNYEDRWCYHDFNVALAAAHAWACDGLRGEPEGWHRHPTTGRRRTDGDPATEYVNM